MPCLVSSFVICTFVQSAVVVLFAVVSWFRVLWIVAVMSKVRKTRGATVGGGARRGQLISSPIVSLTLYPILSMKPRPFISLADSTQLDDLHSIHTSLQETLPWAIWVQFTPPNLISRNTFSIILRATPRYSEQSRGFQQKKPVYIFYLHMRATFPSHLILNYFLKSTNYKSLSAIMLLHQNIFLAPLFSNTLTLYSFPNVKNQASLQWYVAGKSIVL
jgi:hypothetical protein